MGALEQPTTIRAEIGPTLKLAIPIMLGMLGDGLMFVVDVAMVEVFNDLPVVVILDVAVILNSAATSGLLLVVFILADLNQLGVH